VIPFIIAAPIAFAFARWLSVRLAPSLGLDRAEGRQQLYVLVALVVLLHVTTSLIGQSVGSLSIAPAQSDIFPGGIETRLHARIASGVASGTSLGLAIGIIGYVIGALRRIVSRAEPTPLDVSEAG
jgi:hypothetical protein